MAKTEKRTITLPDANADLTKPGNCPNKAISIVYTGNKKYCVAEVEFNAQTGETGNVKIVESDLDIYESQHVFKTQTIKLGLFDEGNDN